MTDLTRTDLHRIYTELKGALGQRLGSEAEVKEAILAKMREAFLQAADGLPTETRQGMPLGLNLDFVRPHIPSPFAQRWRNGRGWKLGGQTVDMDALGMPLDPEGEPLLGAYMTVNGERVYYEGQDLRPQEPHFDQKWLQRLIMAQPDVLRMLDWQNMMHVNSGKPGGFNPDQLTHPEAGLYGVPSGVPYWVMFELCRLLGCKLWLHVLPDQTDFKSLIDTRKEYADVKVQVEYANEVWNPAFQWSDTGAAYGYLAAEAFDILADAWQGLDSGLTEYCLMGHGGDRPFLRDALENYDGPELSSIGFAPYIRPLPRYTPSDAVRAHRETFPGNPIPYELQIPLQQILEDCQRTLDEKLPQFYAQHRALADSWGLELDLYESGPSLKAQGFWADTAAEADVHPIMADTMRKNWELAKEHSVRHMLHYGFCAPQYPRMMYGSWNLMQHLDDTSNPKWVAFLQWQREQRESG